MQQRLGRMPHNYELGRVGGLQLPAVGNALSFPGKKVQGCPWCGVEMCDGRPRLRENKESGVAHFARCPVSAARRSERRQQWARAVIGLAPSKFYTATAIAETAFDQESLPDSLRLSQSAPGVCFMRLQSFQHQVPLHLINTLACCWSGGDARAQPQIFLRQCGELLLSTWSPIEDLVAPSLPSVLEQVLCRIMELRRVGASPLLLTAAECSGPGRRLPVLATAADTAGWEFPEAEQIPGQEGIYLTTGHNDRQCQRARDIARDAAARGQRVLVCVIDAAGKGSDHWSRYFGNGRWGHTSVLLELPPDCFPVGSELGFADDSRAGCGAATNQWTKVGGALHPPRGHDPDKLIRNPAMLSPHAIHFIIVDHLERRHQWSIGDVQDLTEALIAASYADRAEHAKAIQLRAQFQVEAARRWGLAPGHESHLFWRDLKLDPYTILPKAWFTSVLNEFLPNLETSHYPMVGGKEVRRHSEHTRHLGHVSE